jgi:hypothetical protein
MRFIMFMLPNIEVETAEDWVPSAETVAAMTKYNKELEQAGVLLDGTGLHPQNEGTRIEFGAEGKTAVTDGPFTEAKEAIGGYWLIQAKSKEEAVEWASRCPAENCTIEVRQLFELEEFPEDVQAAAR